MEKIDARFKLGDIVQTNIEYMHGFDDNVCPPRGLRWLKSLKIIKIFPIPLNTDNSSQYSRPYFYECKSKSRTYLLNECFLEWSKGD